MSKERKPKRIKELQVQQIKALWGGKGLRRVRVCMAGGGCSQSSRQERRRRGEGLERETAEGAERQRGPCCFLG